MSSLPSIAKPRFCCGSAMTCCTVLVPAGISNMPSLAPVDGRHRPNTLPAPVGFRPVPTIRSSPSATRTISGDHEDPFGAVDR